MYKVEHTVQFIDQQSSITYWATFHKVESGAIVFYEGAAVVSVGIHVSGKSLVTTDTPHGFQVGQQVYLEGVELAAPAVAGLYTVQEVPNATSFKITASVTVAGARGFCGLKARHYVREADVRSVAVGRWNDQRVRDNSFYYA